jgi:hypothetical protein
VIATCVDVIASVVLALWALASLLAQMRVKILAPIRLADWGHLIPNWSFFAPRPARSDYYLCYCDIGTDGRISEWATLTQLPRKSWLTAFWHPTRRETKAMLDAVRMLMRLRGRRLPGLELSLPYLALLQYVDAAPHAIHTVATRFVLVARLATGLETTPKLIFKSKWHRLSVAA